MYTATTKFDKKTENFCFCSYLFKSWCWQCYFFYQKLLFTQVN